MEELEVAGTVKISDDGVRFRHAHGHSKNKQRG
jgi:hypothetical protein